MDQTSDQLQRLPIVRSGGRWVSLVGAVVVFFGVNVFRGLWAERAGTPGLLFILPVAFVAVGLAMLLVRTGVTIDLHAGVVEEWWGLPKPCRVSGCTLLESVSEVAVSRECKRHTVQGSPGSGAAGGGPPLPVYKVWLVGDRDLLVRTCLLAASARRLAQRIAAHAGLPFRDSVAGKTIPPDPKDGPPLAERTFPGRAAYLAQVQVHGETQTEHSGGRLVMRTGTGWLGLFLGLPFLLVSVGALYFAVSALSAGKGLGEAAARSVFAVVFLPIGLFICFWRRQASIDIGRGTVDIWWGLLAPIRRKQHQIKDFKGVAVKRGAAGSAGDAIKVRLMQGKRKGVDFWFCSDQEEADDLAQKIHDLTGLPLM